MRKVIALCLIASACGGSSTVTADAAAWTSLHASADWWMSVYAPAADDRWIVGGTPTEGRVLHYDGSTLTEVDTGAETGLLNWVHGFGNGDLIVVGTDGAVLRRTAGAWAADQPPTDQDLWGVWGANPSDVWAVGGSPVDGQPTVLRDRGDGFEPVELPVLTRPGVSVLFKVWGSGPSDVYVVGQNGAVLHWDGSSLTELFVGVGDDLVGVWGTGPDRIVAVGGRSGGIAALWDGSEWRALSFPTIPGLNGVWFDSNAVHIVGNRGTVGVLDFTSGAEDHASIETPVFLHAVNGSPDGTLTAVGGDFTTGEAGPFRGEVVERSP